MTVELYAHTCGLPTIPHGFLLEQAHGWITVPIPSHLMPGILADRAATLAVLERVRAMQASGARIMFGHDREFWATVPQAPQARG